MGMLVGLPVAHGGWRGLRAPARVAGGPGGYSVFVASMPWLDHLLCRNRKCGLRPQAVVRFALTGSAEKVPPQEVFLQPQRGVEGAAR